MAAITPERVEVEISDSGLRASLDRVRDVVRAAGGRALLVGGSVRDALLGRPAHDLDVEVFGLSADALVEALRGEFDVDLVGRDFGVLKLRGLAIDVSLPRRERKQGTGHRGFEIESDPQMTPEAAAVRRDFTVNAMSADLETGALVDPMGGLQDLNAGVLRHTSDRFAEDPLRVLRGMQFAARFELTPAPETVALCRTIEPEGLAPERIFEEWRKLILRGVRPSMGLAFLRDCGWIRHFPELEALVDCPQNPRWHPEGDVWIHTLHCMDVFANERIGDAREDLVVGLAVLCHDLGKPPTTTIGDDGRVRSKGHERVGCELTRTFLAGMTRESGLVDEVIPLVAEHLAPIALFNAQSGDAAVRRLARRVGRIDRLVRVASADQRGRPPLVFERFEAGEWLLERARSLDLERAAPAPLVLGRHLIDLGLAPGPAFTPILEAVYEAQLDGAFDSFDGGLACARALIAGRTEHDAD